jgi:hypothetical protein
VGTREVGGPVRMDRNMNGADERLICWRDVM